MKNYLKNWGFLAGSDLVSQLVGFLIVIRLASVLSPADYGIFNVLTTLAAIFSILANFGMSQVLIRTIAKFPSATAHLLKNVVPIRIATILFTILVSYCYNLFFSDVKFYILICTMVLTIDTTVWDFVESVSFGKKITKYTSTSNIVFTVLWAIFIFLFPKHLFTLQNIVLVYCVITTLKSLVIVVVSYKKGIYDSVGDVVSYSFDRKEFIKESLPYLWLWGIGSFVSQVPLLLLSKHSSITEVGYYSVGAKLTIPLTMLVGTIFRALFPFMAEFYFKDKNKFNKVISILYTFIIIMGSSVAFFATIVSAPIIPLLFGQKYVSSIGSFNLLIWSAVIYSVDLMIGNALSAANKQGLLAKLTTIDILIGFPIMYYGSYYGASGLALSRLIFVVVAMSYHWIILTRLISSESPSNRAFTFKDVALIYMFLILSFVTTILPISIVFKLGIFSIILLVYYNINGSPIKFLIENLKSIVAKKGF